jgi:toxin ParE1/3/4
VRLRFSSEARADLFDIVRSGAERFGEQQARSYVTALRTKLLLLLEHPYLGPASDDIEVGLRRYPYVSHVAYYRLVREEVRIVRVLHRRMNAQAQLG